MRILVVGDGQSIWIAKYIERVLVPLGHKVTVWTSRDVPAALHESYSNEVQVVPQPKPHPLVAGIPWVRRISLRARAAGQIGRLGDFDVVHVHFVSLASSRLAFMINARRVLSYWGSDLLRRTPEQLRHLRPFLQRAEVVTVNSLGMWSAFLTHYGDLGVAPVMIPFGVTGIDAIDRLRATESRVGASSRFGFPPDRLIVAVGYNGRPQQQHLMMLSSVAGLEPEVKARLHVVLPMTYGADETYVEVVREALERTGCSGTVLTDFLGEEDQARLAIATDLFVNAQTTDALSATLQEFLYAGAVVLNGSWLAYPELSEAGVVLYEFSTVEDLRELVGHFVMTGISDDETRQVNQQAMRSRSWGALANEWAAIYDLP